MQKKLLLVLAIVASALVSHAQVEKKDWLLGGTFRFNTNNSNDANGSTSGSNSNLNPELGWAVAKNSIIGFRGGFSVSNWTGFNGGKSTATAYSAGLFWKKLFPINEKAGWYGDLSSGYSHSNNKFTDINGTNKSASNAFYASLSPGVYYKPSGKILLNAGIGGLGYTHTKADAGTNFESKTNSFNVTLLNYFSFGVSFIIS